MSITSIEGRIAGELGVRVEQVAATVGLLDGGFTVPFVGRYRKAATAGHATEAAHRIGISRATLYRHGIDPADFRL